MKMLLPTTAILFAVVLPAAAQDDSTTITSGKILSTTQDAEPSNCKITDDLCNTCDGGNVTDATGSDWAVSCGWSIVAGNQKCVEGDATLSGCTDACNDSNDCWAVNIAADGSCSLVTDNLRGMSRKKDYTALVRFADADDEPDATSTSTSAVRITATISGPRSTLTSEVPITSTSAPSSSPTSSSQCDLQLTNLCPKCDGEEIDSEQGNRYQVRCDQDLWSNSSYSPQDWMSPGECLDECDKLEWCKGTMYYNDRDCELARGEDVFPVSKADYTAFLPVATGVASSTPKISTAPSSTQPAVWNITRFSSSAEPTFSILPIDSGCDLASLLCPACDGMPYDDRLNGSYTVVCGVEPDCVSLAQFRDGADDQEQCLQSCDQDVTCLAAMWFPQSSACHLCQQGMEVEDKTNDTLPYVLLVADMHETDDDSTTSTTTRRSTVYSGATSTRTLVSPTSRSITDLPQPFSTSSVAVLGPVGPVSVSSFPRATGSSPASPLINATSSTASVIHLTSSSIPATVTNAAAVSCPASNHGVYVVPESGNYFGVECDQIFTAAHSRFTTASDFAACAASCTGQCDGIQFGYSTRCGLYTDISVVGSANGWTVGASITFPVSATMTAAATVTAS